MHQDRKRNEKSVLIISYVFPPEPGIGGRRWAKFAKYLNKNNIDISVISTELNGEGESPWTADVINIAITRLPSGYPKILSTSPSTIVSKIGYRLRLIQVKLSTLGNYYDKAIFFEQRLKKSIIKLVQEKKIQNIIVSGFPFNLVYFVARLKPLLPDVKIISDFRDPWVWKKAYSLDSMSQFRQKEEGRKEKYVIEYSDLVLVPSEIMQKELFAIYPRQQDKIKVLEHGFDTDETLRHANIPSTDSKVSFIIYGSIYTTIAKEINKIGQVLSENQENSRLDLYSDHTKYRDEFEKRRLLNKNVFYHASLTEKELYHKLIQANYYLLVCPDYAKDYLITKIFEIIYHRIPIIFIGEYGEAGDFIEKNRLGLFIHKSEIQNNLTAIIKGDIDFEYNYDFDVSSNSFQTLTKKLLSYLK
jgi:glycosyltransferase involved in cell wall biosynthesis